MIFTKPQSLFHIGVTGALFASASLVIKAPCLENDREGVIVNTTLNLLAARHS